MSKAAKQDQTPEGYWKDAEGRLVPDSLVKPLDRERDELVQQLIAEAREQSAALATFKASVFDRVAAFVERSGAAYKVKMRGSKGNITLTSFDGRYKVVRQVQESISFDERLQVAKSLIDQCIQEWLPGSSDEIRVLVNDAFQVNRQGQVDTARVLGLRRLDIDNAKWKRAMQAIGDSVVKHSSKSYVRFYERVDGTDQYAVISLDMATL